MVQKQKSNFVGIGFFRLRKVKPGLSEKKMKQVQSKQTNKTQPNFFSQCTLSKEIYSLSRTLQGLTRFEIDLTADRVQQKCREVAGKKGLL